MDKVNVEEWRDVVGHEGIYQVSSFGNIRRTSTGKNLSMEKNTHGYHRVCLSKNGYYKRYRVHRLVALAFIPNSERKETVNHINGIKTDNRVDNLEWLTMRENFDHAVEMGLSTHGSRNPASKLTESEVIDIHSHTKKDMVYLASKYKVGKENIRRIMNRESWKNILKTEGEQS